MVTLILVAATPFSSCQQNNVCSLKINILDKMIDKDMCIISNTAMGTLVSKLYFL